MKRDSIKPTTIIENANTVLKNGIFWDGVLLLFEDKIFAYGSVDEMERMIAFSGLARGYAQNSEEGSGWCQNCYVLLRMRTMAIVLD